MPLLKTPTSNLGSNGGSQHPVKRASGGHGPNLADEVEWLLPTPKASDATKGSPDQRHDSGDLTLPPPRRRCITAPRADAEQHPHARTEYGKGLATAVADDGRPAVVRDDRGLDRRWGPYAAAITRWETLTRPAPPPTDDRGRLRAEFVE